MIKVGMISLGCEKNKIDAEVMLALIKKRGYELCSEPEECDVIIVNTCTFIGPAKEESIAEILNAAQYKNGKLKKLIVTGCMAQRYQNEILKEIPEVDAVLGSKSFDRITDAIESSGIYEYYKPLNAQTPEGDRVLTSGHTSVYIKIADGCSNHCSYCVIPSVRGEFQARTYESVLSEITTLTAHGAREINLIAQDTTRFPDLCRVIRETCKIPTVKWVRVLYCRPEGITDEFLELMSNEEKFVGYIDMPLQHASEKILKLMNRGAKSAMLLSLIDKIRKKVDGVALRTTFITGFPHETDEDFEILCNFIKEAKFDNLGVFTYSREEGTKAASMRGQIDEQTKFDRADIIMTIQARLLEEINTKHIGKTYDVLCEGEKDGKYFGRAYFQAPDIDGRVIFESESDVSGGEFVKVKINSVDGYDLLGVRDESK